MSVLPSPQQLRYLVSLAEQRHFGRAAAACAVTQSTLSAGILALERQLDVRLLDRGAGRRVVLTGEGQAITRRARLALEALEAVAGVADSGEAAAGEIRLGMIPTIGPFVLRRLLGAAQGRARLSLREDVTERLLRDVRQGRLDAAVVAVPCDCRNLETLPLLRDELMLALPPAHPLAERDSVPIGTLDDEAMLLLEDGHCLRDHVLAVCRQQAGWSDGAERFAATGLAMLAQMVAAGLGVTLLPRLAIDAGLVDGLDVALRPLAGEGGAGEPDGAWRTIALAWRGGHARSEVLRGLGRALAAQLSNHPVERDAIA